MIVDARISIHPVSPDVGPAGELRSRFGCCQLTEQGPTFACGTKHFHREGARLHMKQIVRRKKRLQDWLEGPIRPHDGLLGLSRGSVRPPEKSRRVRGPRASDEWYTPEDVIFRVRAVMGGIDCDPASCEAAQSVVQATVWHDRERNGLAQKWCGRVYLNPPYSYPLVERFTRRLVEQMGVNATEAVCVVNSATDAGWYQELMHEADASCLPKGRFRFWRADRTATCPRVGQTVFYLGPNVDRFQAVFGGLGEVRRNERSSVACTFRPEGEATHAA